MAEDLTGTLVVALNGNYFSHFPAETTSAASWPTWAILQEGMADLVSFGKPLIAKPDLVERFEHHIHSAYSNVDTYYAGGESGYTDYPRAV